MNHIDDLKDVYLGRPIAILGGGPNLIRDMKRIPKDSILIGINNHAEKEGVACLDYMCFCDSPKYCEHMTWVNDFEGRRISPIESHSDWIVPKPYWNWGLTFTFATWVALHMGGYPIILCGFDCFLTGEHFHDTPGDYKIDYDRSGKNIALWIRVKDEAGEDSARIRAISGILTCIFGKY